MEYKQKQKLAIIAIIVVAIIATISFFASSKSSSGTLDKLPLPPMGNLREGYEPSSNQVIGMIYPPRLGPLHSNFVMPDDKDSCQSPYAVIYEDKVVFNQCLPNVR